MDRNFRLQPITDSSLFDLSIGSLERPSAETAEALDSSMTSSCNSSSVMSTAISLEVEDVSRIALNRIQDNSTKYCAAVWD